MKVLSTPALTLIGRIRRALVLTLMVVVVFVQTSSLLSAPISVVAAFTFPPIRSNTLIKVHERRHLDLTVRNNFIYNNNHVNTRTLKTQIQQHDFYSDRNTDVNTDTDVDVDADVPMTATDTDVDQNDKDIHKQNWKTSIMAVKKNLKQMIHLTKALALKMKVTILNFLLNENFGKRGEIFIVMELILLYSFLANKAPIVHDLLQFLFGPLLFITGSTLMALSFHELHSHQHHLSVYTTPPTPSLTSSSTPSLTSSSTPSSTSSSSSSSSTTSSSTSSSTSSLVTTGIYSYIRHPFYMGTLCAFLGSSFITKSTTRLLMSVFYYILIDRKCQQEDYALLQTYKHLYMNYERQVKNRFVPTKDAISSFLRRFNHVASSSITNSTNNTDNSSSINGMDTVQQGLNKIESNLDSQNNTVKSMGTLFP